MARLSLVTEYTNLYTNRVQPNSAQASARTLGLPNLAASVGIGVQPNIVASVTDEIGALDDYCTDGTTTCASPPCTNFGATREGHVKAGFYGTDPFEFGVQPKTNRYPREAPRCSRDCKITARKWNQEC